jgi:heat shock protein HslJ
MCRLQAFYQHAGCNFCNTEQNPFMQAKLFTGVLLLILLMACATARNPAKENPNLYGGWTLSVFQPAQKKTLAEWFGTRVIELRFEKDGNTVSGTTGCNRFQGTYTADTANLTFTQNRALTRMACPGYDEQLFLRTLNQINRYRLIEGQLELMQNEAILLIFAKKM